MTNGDNKCINNVEYIKSRLTDIERLLVLTEEALELALASLKLHRVLDGVNPTPVTKDQATENLLEECGDVLNCMEVLISPIEYDYVFMQRLKKMDRWVNRLKNMPNQ